MEIFKFYSDLFVLVHVRIRQCEFQWHGLHMEYMARDWHDFLNVAWQTVDVRKARKMVIKLNFGAVSPEITDDYWISVDI